MTEGEEEQALTNAKPSWLTDGKGIKGDEVKYFSERAVGFPDAERRDEDKQQPQTIQPPVAFSSNETPSSRGGESSGTKRVQSVTVSGGGTMTEEITVLIA